MLDEYDEKMTITTEQHHAGVKNTEWRTQRALFIH